MDMEKEIIELIVDNTGVSTEQAKIIAKEINKLHVQNKIDLLMELNQIGTRREYNGIAYYNLLYQKIEELQKKVKKK
jgi:hypothetical protein